MEGQLTQHLCTPTSAQLAPPSSMVFAREHLGKRLGSEVFPKLPLLPSTEHLYTHSTLPDSVWSRPFNSLLPDMGLKILQKQVRLALFEKGTLGGLSGEAQSHIIHRILKTQFLGSLSLSLNVASLFKPKDLPSLTVEESADAFKAFVAILARRDDGDEIVGEFILSFIGDVFLAKVVKKARKKFAGAMVEGESDDEPSRMIVDRGAISEEEEEEEAAADAAYTMDSPDLEEAPASPSEREQSAPLEAATLEQDQLGVILPPSDSTELELLAEDERCEGVSELKRQMRGV